MIHSQGRIHKRIAQIRQKETSKHPQRLKCTANGIAKQMVLRCYLHLFKLGYIHLAQNWPLSMQMSLIAKKVQFTNTSAVRVKIISIFRELAVTEAHLQGVTCPECRVIMAAVIVAR